MEMLIFFSYQFINRLTPALGSMFSPGTGGQSDPFLQAGSNRKKITIFELC